MTASLITGWTGRFTMKSQEFYRLFQKRCKHAADHRTSGIGIAAVTAQHFKVRRYLQSKTSNIGDDLYRAMVHSFTHGSTSDIVVSKKYISAGDRVLIIDDFWQTVRQLSDLCL